MATTPISLDRPDGKGLAAGTLGLWGSTVIGLASTAPVYSLVATLGFVVLAVGAQAPIVFVVAFIPMLFIAFAYRELNNAVPDRLRIIPPLVLSEAHAREFLGALPAFLDAGAAAAEETAS